MNNEVTLHIDSREDYFGQVLQVTSNETGEIIPYKVELVDENSDMDRFATSSKIHFHNACDDEAKVRVVKYFTHTLGSAMRIVVYGDMVERRYPSTCAYMFDAGKPPVVGADPPFHFDYGVARAVTPVNITCRQQLPVLLERLREEAFNEESAHDFPGVTENEDFLEVLRSLACPDIEEDVLSVAHNPDYRNTWYPTLRRDGVVGVYETTDKKNAYVIVESALPYFICDQLICLVRSNVAGWTWEAWVNSAEVRIAREVSREVVDIVRERVLDRLVAEDAIVKDMNRSCSEEFILHANTLEMVSDDVSYDAEIARPKNWYKKTLLVRIIARDVWKKGYALIKNINCEETALKVVVPTTFYVPTFDNITNVVKTIKASFGIFANILRIDVLLEVTNVD